ncbi:S41 family peptidase [Aurantivibrio plasticivorans]
MKGQIGVVGVLSLLLLGGCGSDDRRQGSYIPGIYRDVGLYANQCAFPRTGIDPRTNAPYPDRAGSFTDENLWLRSMSNDLYLWYDELPDVNPSFYSNYDYFDLLVSSEITESGAFKDQFHFALPTEEWVEIISGVAVERSFGMQLEVISGFIPREVVVSYVEPGSVADTSGVTRGSTIQAINGVDIDDDTTGGVNLLNEALFAPLENTMYTIEFLPVGAPSNSTAMMETELVAYDPVPNGGVQTINTAAGLVGYLLFNDHNAAAESDLIAAFDQFQTDGVTDLVLDLRYNGGGYLDMASQVAYMVAGPANTAGQTFELIRFNNKHPSINPITGEPIEPVGFHSVEWDYFAAPAAAVDPEIPLPSLNLDRVFVLTSNGTCSASESIINGLRGVGVEVYQFGTGTCGKPYGFYELPNCGTSYFTIQFAGENAQGFGDFGDGFNPENSGEPFGALVPGCYVEDDYQAELGDPAEVQLAAALDYRAGIIASPGTEICPPLPMTATNLSTNASTKQYTRTVGSKGLSQPQSTPLLENNRLRGKVIN